MKINRYLYVGISLALAILTFACSLFSPILVDSPPAELPAESEQQPAPEVAAEPAAPIIPLPIGVATDKSSSGDNLTVFDREGYTLAQVTTPGLFYSEQGNIHFAGPLVAQSNTVPIIYYSFEQNNSLLLNNNSQITTLLDRKSVV